MMGSRVLVSACLLGLCVRYNAKILPTHPHLTALAAEGRAVPFCPEVAGGLPTPRPPAECPSGGEAVLAGIGHVVNHEGQDVTLSFLAGARLALQTAQELQLETAVLKEGSPSCGSTYIYDGSFSDRRVTGMGVTAALLRQAGITVFSEDNFPGKNSV